MQEEAVTDKEGGTTGEYRFEHSGANAARRMAGRPKVMDKRQQLKDDFKFYARNCLHIKTGQASCRHAAAKLIVV
jgi:hypothetical protein